MILNPIVLIYRWNISILFSSYVTGDYYTIYKTRKKHKNNF